LGAYAWSSNAAENLQSRIERQAEPVVPIVPVVPVLPVVPLASVDSVLSRHNLKQHQVQEPIVETSHRVHTTPGISPSVYMDQAWEKASSVASSVMSTATKQRLLATLPMLKWQDKDGRLLESCCIKGNPAAVRILLKEAKLNPGTKAKPRRAPMSLAIRGRSMKHNKCVRYLLESGADINMRSRDGSTPLHWAIDNADWPGYNNLIYDLLLFSADPNIRDYGGNAPIQKIFDSDATKPLEDHRRIALALLLKTPLKQGVDLKVTMPGSGYSVLHLAVQRRSAIAIGMLINKGADVNVRDTTDTTPLILAANQWRGDLTENQKSMLEQLLSAKTLAVNFQGGSELCTALHYAAKAGAVVAVKALLDCGADAQLRCKRDRTALLWALPGMESSSHSEVVDLLTKAMGLKWSLALDRPVLDQALANKKLLKSILASGFSVDDPLTDGRCLLCAAIDAKMTQAVSAILAHGASTEWMKNNKLVRACDYAEEGGNREIVGLLKAHESKSPTMPSA
jgi:ankyrin repeat protein